MKAMRPFSRRRFVGLAAAAPGLLRAQAEFSSAVKVVSLLVTVRDKAGKFVNELTQQDFVVADEGQPQTIAYFTRQYDLPLTLGLLVDTSGSQLEVLGKEIDATVTFFNQVLREDMDQAFLTSFDAHDYMLQSVTTARAKLEGSLHILRDANAGRRMVNQTVLYDSIVDASERILKKYQGRKALILLTDGEDTASQTSLERAVEAAQRTDTVIYSVGIGANLSRGRAALDDLSQKTGGRFFEVSGKHPVEEIYRTVEEELRSQYNIGYAPPPTAAKNRAGYHRVRVTVKNPGMTARTREGYYSGG